MARVAACLVLLGALACASEDGPTGPTGYRASLAESGRGWYVTYCAACHGVDGRGRGPAAEAMAQAPTDLTRLAEGSAGVFDAGAVAAYVDGRRTLAAHGSREMPVWGRRFDDRGAEVSEETRLAAGAILLIVEHLRTIQSTAAAD
jgi:mono/diheme cytochrome c family protein